MQASNPSLLLNLQEVLVVVLVVLRRRLDMVKRDAYKVAIVNAAVNSRTVS